MKMRRVPLRALFLLLIGGCFIADARAGLSILKVCNEGSIPVWIGTVTESRFLVFGESFEASAWLEVAVDDCRNVWTLNTSSPVMLNVVVGVMNAAGDFGVMGRELSGMANIRNRVCMRPEGFPSTDSASIPPCSAPYREVPTYSAYWIPANSTDIKLEVGFSQADVATLHAVLSPGTGTPGSTASASSSSSESSRSKGFWEMVGSAYEEIQQETRQLRAACLSWPLAKTEPDIDRTAFCSCAAEALAGKPADSNTVYEIRQTGWIPLEVRSCQRDPYIANIPLKAPTLKPGWLAVNKQLDEDLWEYFGLSLDWRIGAQGQREYAIAYWYPDHRLPEAGLTSGDVIQKIGDSSPGPIRSQRDLIDQLNRSVTDGTPLVNWTVVRNGEVLRFEVPRFGSVAPRR
jgi:hypothetical protein